MRGRQQPDTARLRTVGARRTHYLGGWLREMREARNLTQPEFAPRLYISVETLRRWEQEGTVPKNALRQIADALNVPIYAVPNSDEARQLDEPIVNLSLISMVSEVVEREPEWAAEYLPAHLQAWSAQAGDLSQALAGFAADLERLQSDEQP